MLESLILERKISKDAYKVQKQDLQNRFFNVAHTCWVQKIPVLIIFEGWDASGKGDAIKCLTEHQDPRGFRVEYFTDPRTHEKQYPWLRRFWLRLPSKGQVAIFDTSWYRRVLAERTRGEVSEGEVVRNLRDIVKLEHMLACDGTVIIKLMFHISKKEQAKRLAYLEKHPQPGFRITETEWGLHRHYDDLLVAAEEMLARTESASAPWHLIPATQKRYGQIKAMEIIVTRMEEKVRDLDVPIPELRPEKHSPRQTQERPHA